MTTAQLTQANLAKLSVLKLYEHYAAIERSLPLLTSESQDLAQSELEQCLALRSEKIDRLYYAWAHHEDAVERAKKEQELLASAKKHHESQVTQIKSLINWLRRSAPIDDNKIKGKDYEFTLSRKKAMTVLISSDIQDWTEEEQQKYCIMETITTTKHTVVTSIDGKVLEEDTKPTTKTETIPNLNALLNAYQKGQHIPSGVKIQQDYNIRRARILVKRSVELSPSAYPSEFLSELNPAC
jgi:histidinol phosphatase-like enzyme